MRKKIGTLALMLMFAVALFNAQVVWGEYARSDVYYIVPSDTSFQVSMPDNYASYTDITGSTEDGATALSDIVFNVTSLPSNMVQPHIEGDPASAQTSELAPIFRIDNTGNVAQKYSIRLTADEPANTDLMANATCEGTCTSSMQSPYALTTAYQELADDVATTGFVNVTLYGNFSISATVDTGATNVTSVLIKSEST